MTEIKITVEQDEISGHYQLTRWKGTSGWGLGLWFDHKETAEAAKRAIEDNLALDAQISQARKEE